MPTDLFKLKHLVIQLEKDLELAKEAVAELEAQNEKEKKEERRQKKVENRKRSAHLSARNWYLQHVKPKEQQH